MLPSKTYKADLKGKYEMYLKISFIVTLLIVIAAFKFSPKPIKTENIKPQEEDTIFIAPPIQTIVKEKPPDLPKPVIPIIALGETTDDIIFDDVSIDEKKQFTKLDKVEKVKIPDEDIPFHVVEIKPEIIGGMESLQKKLSYPEILRRTGINGKVIIGFIVNKDGDVESAEVIQSLHSQLDEIVLNAVKALKFKPGEQRGKPVKVKMKIPINFTLK